MKNAGIPPTATKFLPFLHQLDVAVGGNLDLVFLGCGTWWKLWTLSFFDVAVGVKLNLENL